MMGSNPHNDQPLRDGRDRLEALLAEEAVVGVADEDRPEMNTLLHRFPEVDGADFEAAAAAAAAAFVADEVEPMPAEVRDRVLESWRAGWGGSASAGAGGTAGRVGPGSVAARRRAAGAGGVRQ